MTLEEAIKYYECMADECKRKASVERNDYMDLKDESTECRQLAIWLNELLVLRNKLKPKTGKWIKAPGSYVTPGGDPVWCCSECGKGIHVYGIEHGTYGADIADHQWVACPNCGAIMSEDNLSYSEIPNNSNTRC